MTLSKSSVVTLAPAQAEYVDERIRSGRFATEAEVVSAALEALRDQELSLDQWLREEVVPVMIAMENDPSRAIPAEQVFAELKALHSKT